MMNIKIIDSSKEKMHLRIGETEAGYVNALRRYMSFEVPTMAIEDVEFKNNNSILYDEMISHRLGLTPLKTDLESYNLKSVCKCKGVGCPQCELKLILKASGPGTIYASDIKSKDPKVKPVHPQMPIVKLLAGQDIQLEAVAVLGIGREHMKWSPGLVHYRNVTKIDIKKQPDDKDLIVKRCPAKCFETKAEKLAVCNEEACILCNDCVEISEGRIAVTPTNDFFLFIECWGQLSPEEVVIKGLEVFNEQLEEFNKLLTEIKE